MAGEIERNVGNGTSMNMPSIISDVQNPGSLPDKTDSISVFQTHISIVFVADEVVYKVKKPVNFGDAITGQ
jgi:aminoglycoside phosphotransferase family enzyme